MRDNRIHVQPDEFSHELGETLVASLRPPILNRDITTFDPTKFAQSLHKSGCPLPLARRRTLSKKPDSRHFACLLRPRRERQRRSRTAEQRDELATDHSITSSARASSDGGRVRVRALAVTRFMTRSNFVGCSTGIAPGLVPRKILSTSSAARHHRFGMFAP